MSNQSPSEFRVGQWGIKPRRGQITGPDGNTVHLEPKVMDVLVCLAARAPRLVTREQILSEVWSDAAVSDEPLTRVIGELRRAFGDTPRKSRYVATVPKRGYRLVAKVEYTSKASAPVTSGGNLGLPPVVEGSGISLSHVLLFATVVLIAVIGMISANLRIGTTNDPAATTIQRNSIAVLPFRNRSAVADDAYLVDGIHDDIVTQLAKLSFLDKVISRTTMERYRDSTLSVPEIGRELGVSTILEGGIQRSDNRLRINVQLIDVATDKHLWAETYDRDLTAANIFAIQTDIATEIANALEISVTTNEEQQLAAMPTENLAAYDAFLMARQSMARRNVSELQRARAHFETAVSLDPNFVLAHVGLADCLGLLVLYGGLPESDYAVARDIAERALTLDVESGQAHATLGYLDWRVARFRLSRYARSEINFLRAQELAPHYVPAYQWYAMLLLDIGRHADAAINMRHAISLDPLDPNLHTDLATIYGRMSRKDSAIDSLDRAFEIDPGFAPTMTVRGGLHLFFREPLEAIIWYRKALALDPSSVHAIARMISAYLAIGDLPEAELWYNRLQNTPDTFWKKVYAIVFEYSRNNDLAGYQAAERWLGENPECRFCIETMLHQLVADGDYASALQLAGEHAPGLLSSPDPVVEVPMLFSVAPTAAALIAAGRRDEAERLLEVGLDTANTLPRLMLGDRGRGIEDVRMYVLLERYGDAVAAFREAYDQGWRFRHEKLEKRLLGPLESDQQFRQVRAYMTVERLNMLRTSQAGQSSY